MIKFRVDGFESGWSEMVRIQNSFRAGAFQFWSVLHVSHYIPVSQSSLLSSATTIAHHKNSKVHRALHWMRCKNRSFTRYMPKTFRYFRSWLNFAVSNWRALEFFFPLAIGMIGFDCAISRRWVLQQLLQVPSDAVIEQVSRGLMTMRLCVTKSVFSIK